MPASKLTYSCGTCALVIDGDLAQVLEAARLHEHDWQAFVEEVETSLRFRR